MPEAQIINTASRLEKYRETLKRDRTNLIAHQVRRSAVADADVVSSQKIRAEVTSDGECNHKSGKSEMSLLAHGVFDAA